MSGGWVAKAICVGADPELFFPSAESGAARTAQEKAAKAVCAHCPVLAECCAWALEALPHGVAGGLTEAERNAMRVGKGAAA